MDGERFSIRTISGVIKQLAKRKDIKNLLLVIEDFRKAANIVLTVFQNDGHYVPTNKAYKTTKA